jgi:hypothetical protein
MMYADKFAAAIKCGRAFLREFKDITYVPFGSEYSIYLKNLNNVRALVSITIDGKSATDGINLTLQPNSEAVLERFIKNGNFSEGNRFKFIERTPGVEQHRGISAEDGLIRIEYWFEKETPKIDWVPWVKPHYPWERRRDDWYLNNNVEYSKCFGGDDENFLDSEVRSSNIERMSDTVRTSDAGLCSTERSRGITGSSATYSANVSAPGSDVVRHLMKSASVNHVRSAPQNDVGVTAPGSVSDQKFKEAAWFATETQSHVIVLRLLGETEEGKRVRKPVTTRMKPKCTMCGHQNRASNKCCSECGAGLELVV